MRIKELHNTTTTATSLPNTFKVKSQWISVSPGTVFSLIQTRIIG